MIAWLLLLCGQYLLVESVANIVYHYKVNEGKWSKLFQLGRIIRGVAGLIVTIFACFV